MTASNWQKFWDGAHSIYVNARHSDVHYRDVAQGIAALLPREGLRVLDFGCGDAAHADIVAAKAQTLYLCEQAATARASMAARFARVANIRVVTPDEAKALPDGSLDLIVANSVLQYLTREQFAALLTQWRRQLGPGGTLIVGDVIPPNVSIVSDVVALLRYAAKNGFLIAAFGGLARTFVSDYRRVRGKLGITTYTQADLLDALARAGFDGQRLARNLEHNPARMTFRALPRA